LRQVPSLEESEKRGFYEPNVNLLKEGYHFDIGLGLKEICAYGSSRLDIASENSVLFDKNRVSHYTRVARRILLLNMDI